MLVDFILLYEKPSVANSPINMIIIRGIPSDSILVTVACTEISLLTITKAVLFPVLNEN